MSIENNSNKVPIKIVDNYRLYKQPKSFLKSQKIANNLINSIISKSVQHVVQKQRMPKVLKQSLEFAVNVANNQNLKCCTQRPDQVIRSTYKEDDISQSQTQKRIWKVPIVYKLKKNQKIKSQLKHNPSIRSYNRSSRSNHNIYRVSKISHQKSSLKSSNPIFTMQNKNSQRSSKINLVEQRIQLRNSKFRYTQKVFLQNQNMFDQSALTIHYLKQMIPSHFIPLYQDQQQDILLALMQDQFQKQAQMKRKTSVLYSKSQPKVSQLIQKRYGQTMGEFIPKQDNNFDNKFLYFGLKRLVGQKSATRFQIPKPKKKQSFLKQRESHSSLQSDENIDKQFKIPKKIFLGNYVKFDNKKDQLMNQQFTNISQMNYNQNKSLLSSFSPKRGLKKLSENNLIAKLNKTTLEKQQKQNIQNKQILMNHNNKLSSTANIFQLNNKQLQNKQNNSENLNQKNKKAQKETIYIKNTFQDITKYQKNLINY